MRALFALTNAKPVRPSDVWNGTNQRREWVHDCKKTLQPRPLERGRPSPSDLIDEYSFQVTAAIEQANREFESQQDTVPGYLSVVFTHWKGVYQGLLLCGTTNRYDSSSATSAMAA